MDRQLRGRDTRIRCVPHLVGDDRSAFGSLVLGRARRETYAVLAPGASRQQLARTLNGAYADGLLSEQTLSHRLDLLFGSSLIDPAHLIGDLTRRVPRHRLATTIVRAIARVRGLLASRDREPYGSPMLLALDWTGGHDELRVGRDPTCDVRLASPLVSRRPARLIFHDGGRTVQDLGSTNGTAVNGKPVGRCQLRPGDDLRLGDALVRVD